MSGGHYAAAAAFLPVVPAGSFSILRKTKAGGLVIDIAKGKSRSIGKTALHHFENHHIWFGVLGGTDAPDNLIKMRVQLHRGKKVGVHQHLIRELNLKSIQQLRDLWVFTLSTGRATEKQKFAQDIYDAYRSYFQQSPHAERILRVFKEVIELEAGVTLR
ncbi:MAG: hypothetical protein R3C99_13250 [Pirellulaceae bacterium]